MGAAANLTEDLPHRAARLLARIRRERPKVHCLTNYVAMNISANAVLAVGAVPSMTMTPLAMSDFVRSTQSLVVNLGMLEPEREKASRIAVEQAELLGKPWALDPVKIERSGSRLAVARELLAAKPSAMRANRDEIEALADAEQAVDRNELADKLGCVIAETGSSDMISDGEQRCRIVNGHPLMAQVTAMGCAASAIMGAFLAVEEDAFIAICSALMVMSIAGEIAGAKSRGPGSFQSNLLDALFELDERMITKYARLK
ncbi:MAG: hydroxyethylthiazole kinase [Pseudomonadota bacterium]